MNVHMVIMQKESTIFVAVAVCEKSIASLIFELGNPQQWNALPKETCFDSFALFYKPLLICFTSMRIMS